MTLPVSKLFIKYGHEYNAKEAVWLCVFCAITTQLQSFLVFTWNVGFSVRCTITIVLLPPNIISYQYYYVIN